MAQSRIDGIRTKKEIVYIAKDLFSRKGYTATSISDICNAMNMSKGSLYHHFKNKEKLFLEIVEESVQDWLNKWEFRNKEYTNSTEKLFGLAQCCEEYCGCQPLLKIMQEYAESQPCDPEICGKFSRSFLEVYQKIIEEGIDSGEFIADNAADMAYILSALMEGLGKSYFDKSHDEVQKLYSKAIAFLLNGIRKEKD